jgi:putative flippase GtrA
LLTAVRHIVLSVIDFFHKPFARFIDKQTFRYLACGGSNAVLNVLIYYVSFHYLLHEQNVLVGANHLSLAAPDTHNMARVLHISAEVAAFIIAFCISFPIGFVLSRYIVFPESELRGRVQLFRYAVTVGMCLLLNYLLIKVFMRLGVYPTMGYVATQIMVAMFSYFTQRIFTFKVPKKPANA